jgi:hypothetical protein
MFRGPFIYQVACSLETDVSRQGEETCSYNPERYSLDSLPAMFLRVNGHTPQQRGSRCNFDETIHSKTDRGDAARKYSRDHCHASFEAVPGDGEIFRPLSAPRKHLTGPKPAQPCARE